MKTTQNEATRIRSIRLSDEDWEMAERIGVPIERDRSWVIRQLIRNAYFMLFDKSGIPIDSPERLDEVLLELGLR